MRLIFWLPIIALLALAAVESSVKPNILLITIDTLRADHLGCYGYRPATSPNLDRFAKEAVLFRNAYATAPLTLPSHASILTGIYPQGHGIRDNAHFPMKEVPMVQEILKRNGYHTGAFVSAAPLSSSFGLSRGFDFYDDEFSGAERRAGETNIRVLQWLKNSKPPYFLWVHYFDPHAEYEPPEEFRRKFPASPYDGEISFVDSKLPEIMNAAGPDTVTIVTADHGESLGEHSETTHAVFLYNATLHVPLLIRAPGIKPAVKTDPVSLSDIAPTLLQMAGVNAGPNRFDGVSLLGEYRNRTLLAESLYAQRNFGYAPLYACIRDGKKYIQAPQAEFYHLAADPREVHNLIGDRKTEEWQRAVSLYSKDSGKQVETRLPPEEQEKLRSLGYVSGPVIQTGADPKAKIQIIEGMREGMILLQTEKYDQAEKRFVAITRTEQHNGLAFRFLGDALSAQHKYAEAVKAYSLSLQKLPDPEVGIQLAKAQNRLGHIAEAEKVLLDTTGRFPNHAETVFELSSFYAGQQKWDSAFRLLDRDLPEFHNQRGILYTQKGEPEKAVPELLAAIRSQPKAFYWNNLGIARQRLGQLQEAENSFLQALRLNPDYEECEANLAFLLVRQKRWKEAEIRLQRITSRNQKLWRARLALGFVMESQGRTGEALHLYRKLLSEVPFAWPQRQQLESRIRLLDR